MRNVAEIPHQGCKISIFSWNQKYLIKLEQADLEQTYKVSEFDVMGEEAVKKMVSEEFIQSALKRFDEMRKELNKAING
jgi:hypothetical protein